MESFQDDFSSDDSNMLGGALKPTDYGDVFADGSVTGGGGAGSGGTGSGETGSGETGSGGSGKTLTPQQLASREKEAKVSFILCH